MRLTSLLLILVFTQAAFSANDASLNLVIGTAPGFELYEITDKKLFIRPVSQDEMTNHDANIHIGTPELDSEIHNFLSATDRNTVTGYALKRQTSCKSQKFLSCKYGGSKITLNLEELSAEKVDLANKDEDDFSRFNSSTTYGYSPLPLANIHFFNHYWTTHQGILEAYPSSQTTNYPLEGYDGLKTFLAHTDLNSSRRLRMAWDKKDSYIVLEARPRVQRVVAKINGNGEDDIGYALVPISKELGLYLVTSAGYWGELHNQQTHKQFILRVN